MVGAQVGEEKIVEEKIGAEKIGKPLPASLMLLRSSGHTTFQKR
jgi:hypothetical protein